MKKILMGLLTLSVASLAAFNVDAPDNETLVFYGDQTGKIPVNMGIKSDIPTVKYVVYSKVGGAATNISELTADNEVVKLPDFTITSKSNPDTNTYGFAGQETPAIYVQKVGSDGALTNLAAKGNGEDLYVKFIPSSDWNDLVVTSPQLSWNSSYYFSLSPFAYMTKAELETLVKPIGGTVKIHEGLSSIALLGIEIALANGHGYCPTIGVKAIFNETNGKIVLTSARTINSDKVTVTPEEAAQIEGLFTQVQQANAGAIGLRVGTGS